MRGGDGRGEGREDRGQGETLTVGGDAVVGVRMQRLALGHGVEHDVQGAAVAGHEPHLGHTAAGRGVLVTAAATAICRRV